MVTLPADMINPAYAPAILAAVQSGDASHAWSLVTSTSGTHTATFRVFSDALKVNGVRCGVSATLAQQIADVLSCRLLTPKLANLLWLQRTATVVPYPLTQTAADLAVMTKWARAERESALIDAAVAKIGGGGLVQTVGKHWVLDNDLLSHPGHAENYGWHFNGATFDGSAWEPAVTPPLRVIQGRGWAHDAKHVDYSQTCVLVWQTCVVDGHQTTLDAVLQSAELAPLASHQGALKLLRQPGVALPPAASSPT